MSIHDLSVPAPIRYMWQPRYVITPLFTSDPGRHHRLNDARSLSTGIKRAASLYIGADVRVRTRVQGEERRKSQPMRTPGLIHASPSTNYVVARYFIGQAHIKVKAQLFNTLKSPVNGA